MIVWVAPGRGAGHASRAAAIAQHLCHPVTVVTQAGHNAALRLRGVEYVECAVNADMADVVGGLDASFMVGDFSATYPPLTALRPDVWIWRLGWTAHESDPVVRTEGPGGCWPVLMLDDDEILSRSDARSELGLDPGAYLRVAVPSVTRPGFIESFPHDFVLDRFPALRWLRAADHIIGAPGVLWTEVTALGITATWIDVGSRDQALRVRQRERSVFTPDAARRVAAAIDRLVDGLPWVDPTLLSA